MNDSLIVRSTAYYALIEEFFSEIDSRSRSQLVIDGNETPVMSNDDPIVEYNAVRVPVIITDDASGKSWVEWQVVMMSEDQVDDLMGRVRSLMDYMMRIARTTIESGRL